MLDLEVVRLAASEPSPPCATQQSFTYCLQAYNARLHPLRPS